MVTGLWRTIMQLLLFGTPIFIFITALVLSYSYPNGTPKAFLIKRLKFILIPYLIMGVCYATLACIIEGSFNPLLTKIFKNIVLGQFHGYFIIIIFQFYLLQVVFHKLVKVIQIERLVLYSLLVNAVYLLVAGIYFYDSRWGVQFWWLPLCAWIFYYALAYYVGQNLEKFRLMLIQYRWFIGIGSIIGGILVTQLMKQEVFPDVSSKRIDILFYATSICFLLFYIGSKVKKVPYLLELISRYSFGIYWLHVFYIQVHHKVYKLLPAALQSYISVSTYIVILFMGSVSLSVITVYLLNRFQLGAYVAGKVGVPYQPKPSKSSTAERLKPNETMLTR